MLSANKLLLVYFSVGQRACPLRTWHNGLLWCTTLIILIAPNTWPLNSPVLNPVDYGIWSVVQQRLYETRVHDIDELRQCLLHVWCSLEQSLIDDAVDQWPTCVHACVHARGGHFEHTLWLSICFLCSLIDELYVSHHAWCSRWCYENAL